MKNQLALFDLDGTLYDTRYVNYYSYKKALQSLGSNIDFDYFARECNGRHYTYFLPKIVDTKHIETVHTLKKDCYSQFLHTAIENKHLFSIIESIRSEYYTAVVTTASRKNCTELLKSFDRENLFDLIITQENITKTKPDPEGFLLAMNHFSVTSDNTIIFEDSEVGIIAAQKTGATVFVVRGFS